MVRLNYVKLAADALGIPEDRVTEPMIKDLEYGLEIMAQTPLRFTTTQFLEASGHILAHYKKRLEANNESSSTT